MNISVAFKMEGSVDLFVRRQKTRNSVLFYLLYMAFLVIMTLIDGTAGVVTTVQKPAGYSAPIPLRNWAVWRFDMRDFWEKFNIWIAVGIIIFTLFLLVIDGVKTKYIVILVSDIVFLVFDLLVRKYGN